MSINTKLGSLELECVSKKEQQKTLPNCEPAQRGVCTGCAARVQKQFPRNLRSIKLSQMHLRGKIMAKKAKNLVSVATYQNITIKLALNRSQAF